MKDSMMNISEKSDEKEDFLSSCMLVFSRSKDSALSTISFKIKEYIMSHSRLIVAVKLIFFLQYITHCYFAYYISLESSMTPSKLKCNWNINSAYGDTANETFQSVLSTVCLNERYNNRFAAIFIALEIPSFLMLILKIISGTQNSITQGIKNQVSDQLLYAVAAIPKAFIILTPYSKVRISTISIPLVGPLISLLLSPLVFVLRLLIGLITLPVSMFLLNPVKEKIILDYKSFGMTFEGTDKDFLQKSQLEVKKEIDCYKICESSFDSSWNFVFCCLLVSYSILFWFIHFTSNDQDGVLEKFGSKERVSESVEFIRVSEDVSEDFSYDEVTEEKTCVTDNYQNHDEVGLSNDIAETFVSGQVDVNAELAEPKNVNESSFDNHTDSSDSERTVNLELNRLKDITEEHQRNNKITRDVATSVDICVEKLHKACQTITVVEDITQEYIKHKRVSTSEKAVQIDFKHSNSDSKSLDIAAQNTATNGNDEKEDKTFLANGKSIKFTPSVEFRNQKQKKAASYPSVSDIKNKPRPLSERTDVEQLNENVKFSFSELSIVPPDLTLEERIKQKSMTADVSVETFLSELEKEQSKHQVYIEKELLMKMLQDVILTSRVTGTSDCDFCPKSKELARDCKCRIHELIKSFTKESDTNQDSVDGHSFNDGNYDQSDDESFFNGFRL